MGGFSIWHWLIVGLVVLLLFGKGRFSDMMGDVAKGLKSFKKGMTEDDAPPAAPRQIEAAPTPVTPAPAPAAEPTTAATPAPDAESR
jgi:sec-independent protein translocase protein TatA